MTRIVETITSIDLTGLRCPMLARRIRKALSRAGVGERLEFVCADPLASIDIPHLVATLGDDLVTQAKSGGQISFVVRRAARS